MVEHLKFIFTYSNIFKSVELDWNFDLECTIIEENLSKFAWKLQDQENKHEKSTELGMFFYSQLFLSFNYKLTQAAKQDFDQQII